MREIIDQIEASLDQPIYYLSLMGALAVPDIAGALESVNGEASGQKYEQWYERYVRPQFPKMVKEKLPSEARSYVHVENPLTGGACYRFRCSMLHQESTQHPRSPYSRILFVEPGASSNTFHYNIMNDALNIDLVLFCCEMVAGAREWLAVAESTEHYKANYEKFVRRYPDGLKPYIVGIPVVP